MNDIKPTAIILIPIEAIASKMLRLGPCGARPPLVQLYGTKWHPLPDAWFGGKVTEHTPQALVLAWNGKPVQEGIDRVERCGGWRDTRSRLVQWLRGPRHCAYIVWEDVGEVVELDEDLKRIVRGETG